jgi:hypothetical protein
MPQLKLDLSRAWGKPNRVLLSVKMVHWHNKYGIRASTRK